MEKKKKRPNFIDIIFIILVVVVVLVAWLLIHGASGGEIQETVTRSYVVELVELEPQMADCFAVGDSVKDNIRNYDIGEVTDIEVTPAIATVMDEDDGIIREAEIPDKVTILVTIEAETVETEKAISTASGYDLRIGTSVSCTIGQLAASGYIIGLDR